MRAQIHVIRCFVHLFANAVFFHTNCVTAQPLGQIHELVSPSIRPSIDLSLTFIHVRETDARVPLLIHNPAAPQTFGKTTMSLVEHVDLYPTTVEMAMGISVDKKTESIEGDSYAVLFNAKTTPDPASEDAIWMNEWNASFTQYPRCAKKGDDYKNGTQTRCAGVAKADFKYMVSEMLS